MKNKTFIFLFVLFFMPLYSTEVHWKGEADGGFSVDVTLSNNKLPITENLLVSILLKHPSGYSVDTDTLRGNLLKYVGLSEPPFRLEKEEISSQEKQTSAQFTLSPELPGLQFLSLYNIPFLPEEAGKPPKEIISDIMQVEVILPPLGKETKIVPYPLLSLTDPTPILIDAHNRNAIVEKTESSKKIESLLKHKTFPWKGILGAVLFAMAVLFVKLQPKKVIEKTAQKRIADAKNAAFSHLHSAREQKFLENKQYEELYVEITETIRNYLDEGLQMHAAKETTQECLHEIAARPEVSKDLQEQMSQLLNLADKVKFASQKPLKEECLKAIETAKRIIRIKSQ